MNLISIFKKENFFLDNINPILYAPVMQKISHLKNLDRQSNHPHERDDIIIRLQKSYSSLRKSEKKIADYLQQHAYQRLDMSITEFAKLLEVSETTVSRFCRTIGYQGFQDLKLSLAASLNIVEEFQNIPADIHETDSTPEVGKKLSDAFSSAITETQRSLNIETIETAVDAIVKARQVMLYGIGGSSVIVIAAHHLFVKAGINCAVYIDGYMQTVTASVVDEESVVIGVSTSGVSKHVVDAVNIASEKGAITIGMTSNLESPLAKVSQICLFNPGGDRNVPLYGDFMEAKMSQLYIMNLLYLRILFRLGDVSKHNLKETADRLNTYYNPFR